MICSLDNSNNDSGYACKFVGWLCVPYLMSFYLHRNDHARDVYCIRFTGPTVNQTGQTKFMWTTDLMLPYIDLCITLYTQCFPSVCENTSQVTRAGFEPTTSCLLVQMS